MICLDRNPAVATGESVVEPVSHLLFCCLLHAWARSDDLLVASFVNHTGTHWENNHSVTLAC